MNAYGEDVLVRYGITKFRILLTAVLLAQGSLASFAADVPGGKAVSSKPALS